jgi:hypothetical protein
MHRDVRNDTKDEIPWLLESLIQESGSDLLSRTYVFYFRISRS